MNIFSYDRFLRCIYIYIYIYKVSNIPHYIKKEKNYISMLLISGEKIDIILKKGGPKQKLGDKDPQSEWRKSWCFK